MCLGGPFSHVPLVAGDARAAAGQRPLRGPSLSPRPLLPRLVASRGQHRPPKPWPSRDPGAAGARRALGPWPCPDPPHPPVALPTAVCRLRTVPTPVPGPARVPIPARLPPPPPSPPPDRPVCTSADRFHRDPGVTGGPHLPRGVPCESARRAESATRKLSPASGPWWGGVTRGDGGGPKARGPPAGEQSQAGGCGPT